MALSEKVLLNRYETNPQEVPQAHLTVTKTQGWIWVNAIAPHSAITRPLSNMLSPLPENVTPTTVQEVVEDGQSRWFLKNGLLTVEVALDSEFRVHLQQPNGDKTHYDMGHRIIDWQEQGDSYNSAPVAGDTGEVFRLIQIQPGLQGPLVASLILTYDSTSSTQPQMQVQTTVQLKASETRLKFETQFINTRANHKLQVAFNTGAPVTSLWAESHVGVVQRQYDPHYHEVHHLPAAPFKELKTNTGPIQRFVMTQQQLWLTEGLAEYEVRGNDLCFTLHRGFDMLSKGDTGVRGAQAGPPLNTPEGQGLQKNLAYRYGWAPLSVASSHKDSLTNETDWIPVAYHHAQQFYGCISAEHGFNTNINSDAKESPSLISWDNPAVVRLALKPLISTFDLSKAPASATKPLPPEGFILRVLNPTNLTQTVHFSPNGSIQAVYQGDLNEFDQQCLTLTTTGALEPLDLLPGQVLTLTFYA